MECSDSEGKDAPKDSDSNTDTTTKVTNDKLKKLDKVSGTYRFIYNSS